MTIASDVGAQSSGSVFAITGYGRVATKYLSSQLGRVPGWRVEHEPRGAGDLTIRNRADVLESGLAQQFSEACNYGEVNSALKFCLPYLPVKRYGIILRCPKEVFLSVCNRRDSTPLSEPVFIHREYTRFIGWSRKFNISLISFKNMIENSEYLDRLCLQFLGVIPSVKWDKAKLNKNARIAYNGFESLPSDAIAAFNKFDWAEVNEIVSFIDSFSSPIILPDY